MAADVRITAGIDDKISPALTTIDKNIQKFGFSADGMASKLARSFSLTDLAVVATVGTFVKLNQVIDKTAAAYESFSGASDPLISKMVELNNRIKENDMVLGKHSFTWKLFFKETEAAASDAMKNIVTSLEGMAKAPSLIVDLLGKLKGTPAGFQAFALGGGGASLGKGSPREVTEGPQLPMQYTRAYDEWLASWAQGPASSSGGGRSNWWGGMPGDRLMLGGRAPMPRTLTDNFQPDPMLFDKYEDPWIKINAEVEKINEQTELAMGRLSGAFTSMFDAILSGSGNVAGQIQDIFVNLLRDIAAQAAGRAISRGLMSLIPGLGPLLGTSSGGVALESAAVSSGLREMSYRSARGL